LRPECEQALRDEAAIEAAASWERLKRERDEWEMETYGTLLTNRSGL